MGRGRHWPRAPRYTRAAWEIHEADGCDLRLQFDGEEQNVCYGQLVGAAPGSSPPPPPPPSKTDDGTDGDNSDDGEDDGGSSAGAVLGAIVGILLLVGCIVGFVYYFRGRMAKGTPPATDSA